MEPADGRAIARTPESHGEGPHVLAVLVVVELVLVHHDHDVVGEAVRDVVLVRPVHDHAPGGGDAGRVVDAGLKAGAQAEDCLLYTSPSPRDLLWVDLGGRRII